MNFFGKAEKHSNSKINEPTVKEITYKINKPSKNSTMKDNLSNLEIIKIEHKLYDSENKCNICNEHMEIIGIKTKNINILQ